MFTVLIPFRNEGENLTALVNCLDQQSLDRKYWKCLFVNDHSEDNGVAVLLPLLRANYELLHSSGQGKKAAIQSALPMIQTEFIVQTDADCIMGPQWLTSIYDQLSSHPPTFITGPVAINHPQTWLDHFQAMDLIALMGMTQSGIHTGWWLMANGANMAYPTALRKHAHRDPRDSHFASGDDMFLIESIRKHPAYTITNLNCPEAIVRTPACRDIPTLIQQRIRWGSKNAALQKQGIKIALAIPLTFNLLLATLTLGMVFKPMWLLAGICAWLIKLVMDLIYLHRLAPFFAYRIRPVLFFSSSIIYPFYLSYLTILSIFNRQYEWKGRITR